MLNAVIARPRSRNAFGTGARQSKKIARKSVFRVKFSIFKHLSKYDIHITQYEVRNNDRSS